LILDAGFLRSPLAARLADPSVPLAILVAWLAVALPQVFRAARWNWPAGGPAWAPGTIALVLSAPIVFTLASGMTDDFYRRLDKAGLTDRFGKGFERASGVARQLREDWRLETWVTREDRPEAPGAVAVRERVHEADGPRAGAGLPAPGACDGPPRLCRRTRGSAARVFPDR
jgi:hypothetical protein